jgi:peptidoglycan/LPS O-acetylase OafA/YrhL
MRLSRLYIVLIPALVFCYILDFTRVSTYGYNYSAGFETAKSYTIATELGNVLFLQTLLVPTSGSNWALWSLACEFWYYAVFPLLLLPLFSSRGKGVRLTGFLTGIAILLVLGMLNRSVVWLFTIWCFGAAIRVLPTTSRVPEGFLWLLAIFASLGQPYVPTAIRPLGTIAVGITAAAVLWGIRPGAFVPPLTDKLTRWFSQFSFSLYLIHAPLLHFLVTVPWGQKEVDLNIQPYSLRAPVLIASLVIVAYLVAFLFYNLTERHTQAFRRFVMMSFRSKLEPRSRAVLISPP